MGFFDFLFGRIKENDGKAHVAPRQSSFGESKVDDKPQDLSLQQKYKNAYDNFPIVQACVDLTAFYVVQDFYFKGPKESKLNKMIETLNLKTHFRRVVKNTIKQGNCWVEVVKEGIKITKVKILDPLSMNNVRTISGKTIGYVQIVGNKALLWGKLEGEQQTFDSKPVERVGKVDDIVHYKINVQGSEKYGTPPTHAALTMLDIKDQVESDLKVVIKRYISPIIHAKVGSDVNPATSSAIDDVANELTDIYADTEYVTDHNVSMEVLAFKGKGIDPQPILNHIDEQIMIALHTPPVLIGKGGGQDRAVAEVNLRVFSVYIKSLRDEISTQFKDEFIIGQGIAGEEVEIVWGDVDKREEIDEIDRIIKLVQTNLLTPQNANDLLPQKYHEKLPEVESLPNQIGNQNIPIMNNPNDPTKSSKIVKGSRVNKTDFKTHLDEDVGKRDEANA